MNLIDICCLIGIFVFLSFSYACYFAKSKFELLLYSLLVSIGMSFFYIYLQARDVFIIHLITDIILMTVILLVFKEKKYNEKVDVYDICFSIFVLYLFLHLFLKMRKIFTTHNKYLFKEKEDIVNAIILYYRDLDTIGEASVVIIFAIIGCCMLYKK